MLEVESFGGVALEAQTRGEIDVQIRTARAYPRSVKSFIETALEMATLDEETAAACFYALPRDGKTVEGPSARLAEICASAWGHMRAQSRIVSEDDRFITAGAMAWDLQTNVAVGFEVRRRITNKSNKKYSDDMVVVTGNAASSIGLRNAIFKVIPSAFWRPIYLKCREVAVGKAETLAVKRSKMLAYFQKMGVENARVFQVLGIKGEPDITLEHMATLHGLATAIKEEASTVDEAFPPVQVDMPQRKSEQNGHANGQQAGGPAPSTPAPVAETAAPTSTTPAPQEPAGPSMKDLPAGVDIIQSAWELERRSGGKWWPAITRGGVKFYTFDASVGASVMAAQKMSTPVRLTLGTADANGQFAVTKIELYEGG